ncbi:ABC transporter substrate-binding protein [Deinococcus radiodurans]|jgi:maltose-binding protein/trehalose-binding protein/sucrose-binding protein/palatinose-binding protein|uniref:Probable ABC transporter-binding protein DR_1438 n=1 Tax=Deinococcus radiodurans (strain ATCC 13939 / DSM 20539 / JCM 16871 / CCUG 27074 / LMG 4051 / NBRC 15346 / NCIMB 9279 / VKM B-1422 / R1) TaxID=243230 RepID=UE38_DEIRA|nr:ABC transporter substrate-binding protein [Deinococcus radiodurans]Q9RUE8.1 RecName: Full=Probable ABC transporter-binding protein DR_1438; Flags: Precursor [Deinococcus radiodurans R1 = ATCC 13939 = DSM 20539]AAF11010.1 ABC transporter, periplasmic substrate-binding protein, solute-binding family 1 [Deinococcus radiodurans R1 = ATCC 13939 = DSM 20539]ANC71420.1 ABC transporter substrate-binding protein [Deinococcus radiodurans R1 = ATCC 13939 = DSM 20539]QEM70891.1 ABC transporter substrate
MKKFAAVLGLTVAFAAASQAHAVTLTFACDSVGQGFDECKKGADAWAKKTGNTVKLVQVPKESDARLALYQQQLGAKASDVDVYMIDVVWPGLIGQHLMDLSKSIPAAEVKAHFPAIVQNNTVGGKLIAMPWFTDAGVLYYRTDLLKKYGYNAPPKTWNELATMAQKIQAGERKSNPKFVGYVFQGKNYEGLTCDALEWISSFGGGSIVDPSGKITVNNPKAVQALQAIQGLIGTAAPAAVTTYGEEEARNVWQAGNSAFMRNWPYAYAAGQKEGSPIAGKIGVAALPAGPGGKPAATLGGWQLAVNAYSKNPKEAADLVRYLTGAQEQKRRAVQASYNPTIATLYKDKDVLKAVPFFGSLYDVFTNAVARPATVTGSKYNQVSDAFSSAVYSVLTKKSAPGPALKTLEGQLARIKGRGW